MIFSKNTFFPSAILEWNKLDPSLRNSASYNVFNNSILIFIRSSPNNIFQSHNPKGIKLVTRLRLGLRHLRGHKFKHSFQDTLNPSCSCGHDIETISHYFLYCPLFHAERSTLLNNINETDSTIFIKNESVVTCILLYGDESFMDGWSKFANLECNHWFCFVYKYIWWTMLFLWIHRCFSF